MGSRLEFRALPYRLAGVAMAGPRLSGVATAPGGSGSSLNPGPGAGYTALTSVNFDDGTTGPLRIDATYVSDVTVVADPTGAGRGKVLQIHYHGTNQDSNRNVQLWWADFTTGRRGVGMGQGIYFAGDLYIPGTVDTNIPVRKMLYWQSAGAVANPGWPNAPEFWAECGQLGPGMGSSDDCSWGDYTANPEVKVGTYPTGQWTHVEFECVLETAFGAANGLCRRWMDGTLQHNETAKNFLNPAWSGTYTASDCVLNAFYVGDQVSDTTGSFDELRYWDNLQFWYK